MILITGPTGKKAIYLHTPKTGGLWFETVLKGLKVQHIRIDIPWVTVRHMTLAHLLSTKVFDDRVDFIFTFVRNPLDWYESWWRFQVERKWMHHEESLWHPVRELEEFNGMGFDEWTWNILRYKPSFVSRLYESYVGPPRSNEVRIGKFEWMFQNYAQFLTELGIKKVTPENLDVDFPIQNTSITAKPTWSDALRLRAMEVERPALERWYPEVLQEHGLVRK